MGYVWSGNFEKARKQTNKWVVGRVGNTESGVGEIKEKQSERVGKTTARDGDFVHGCSVCGW